MSSSVEKGSEVKPLSRVRLFATPWTVAYQDPQSMGFSRQEYWSGLPFPSPGSVEKEGLNLVKGFSCGSAGKESACNAGDPGLIPGLGRCSGEGKGYSLQYSGLENSITTSTFSHSICHEVIEPDATTLIFFLIFSFKLAFPPSSSPSSIGSLVPLCFLLLEWNHPHIWGCWYFSYLSWFQLVTRLKKGPTFLMMCSAYRLNKQGDNRQPCQYSFLDPESISCSIHSSNS